MTANTEDIRGIIADFKKLVTKIQKDNGEVKKKLKEQEAILSACQKEDESIYYAHELLKGKYQQIEQMQKQQQQQQPRQRKVTNCATSKVQRFKTPSRKHYYVVDENQNDGDDEAEDEGEGVAEEKNEDENEIEF